MWRNKSTSPYNLPIPTRVQKYLATRSGTYGHRVCRNIAPVYLDATTVSKAKPNFHWCV